MPGEERIHDLRHDRIIVSNDPWKDRFIVAQPRNEVGANFVSYRSKDSIGCAGWRAAQGAECARVFGHGPGLRMRR